MGEQPKPVDDEVERALASMRAGFLSGSEQIAAHIASLDQHLVDAPGEEREAVRAQVVRLVSAHERITAKAMSATGSSWDSFKVMVSAVKQQQAVLDQVSHLVKAHVLPRQLESLSALAPPEEPAPPPAADPFPPHPAYPGDAGGGGFRTSELFRQDDGHHVDAGVPDPGMRYQAGGGFAREPMAPPRGRPPAAKRPPRAQPPPRGRSETGYRALAAAGLRTRDDVDDDEPEGPSLMEVLRERTAGFRGLAAMVVVGVILSMLPRDKLQEVGTRLFDFLGPAGSQIATDDPPPKRPPPKVLPRSVDRVPSAGEDEAAPPAPEVKPEPRPPAQKKYAAVSVDDPPSSPPPVVAPKQASVSPADEPVAPPVADGAEHFVPVVFTHKDHATVMRALSDLKAQYPRVLIGLEGEVQPVDMGKKGIWHRLVFLPAGPRPQATRVCDQLAAQGYDRCYVREY